MKPSKSGGAPEAPPRGEAGVMEGGGRDERTESLEGDEGNGGAYGRPRAADDDERAAREERRKQEAL